MQVKLAIIVGLNWSDFRFKALLVIYLPWRLCGRSRFLRRQICSQRTTLQLESSICTTGQLATQWNRVNKASRAYNELQRHARQSRPCSLDRLSTVGFPHSMQSPDVAMNTDSGLMHMQWHACKFLPCLICNPAWFCIIKLYMMNTVSVLHLYLHVSALLNAVQYCMHYVLYTEALHHGASYS